MGRSRDHVFVFLRVSLVTVLSLFRAYHLSTESLSFLLSCSLRCFNSPKLLHLIPGRRLFEQREQRILIRSNHNRFINLVLSVFAFLRRFLWILVSLSAFSQSRLLAVGHERRSTVILWRLFSFLWDRFMETLSADVANSFMVTFCSLSTSRTADILFTFLTFSLGRCSKIIYKRSINLVTMHNRLVFRSRWLNLLHNCLRRTQKRFFSSVSCASLLISWRIHSFVWSLAYIALVWRNEKDSCWFLACCVFLFFWCACVVRGTLLHFLHLVADCFCSITFCASYSRIGHSVVVSFRVYGLDLRVVPLMVW